MTEQRHRAETRELNERAKWIGGIDRGLADIVRRIDRNDATLDGHLKTLEAQDIREAERVQALENRVREDLAQIRARLQSLSGG